MPAVVTAIVLGSQCRSLQSAYLVAPDVGLTGVEIAVLAAMTRLTSLEVRGGLNRQLTPTFASEPLLHIETYRQDDRFPPAGPPHAVVDPWHAADRTM